MTTHDFKEKFAEGQAAEEMLDKFFAAKYRIQKASPADQRRGIDRLFTDRVTGARGAVDYKMDARADHTGNVFVETISVDTEDKRGWAEISEADWIVYYIPQRRRVMLVKMLDIQRWLPLWKTLFPTAKAKNNGYNTLGVLVPIGEFESIAKRIIILPEEN